MIKRLFGIFSLLLVGLLLFVGICYADTYNNYVQITVFNNGTSVYSVIPILISINNTQLANLGYINTTGTDTDLQEGSTDKYFLVASSKLGFDGGSYGSGQKKYFYYRLDNTPEQTSFPVIVGYGGNYTVADNPSIELGNNFTISQKGYIDTAVGSNKNLVYKQNAFRTYISAGGNITSEITGVVQTTPTSTNDPNVDWIGDNNAIDGNTATFATSGAVSNAWSSYLELIPSANLTCRSIRFHVPKDGVRTAASVGIYYSGGWYEVYSGSSHANNAWYTVSFTSVSVAKARLRIYITGSANSGFFNEFDFGLDTVVAAVTATGTSSGEHTVTVTNNTTWLAIAVDGVEKQRVASVSVPDNNNTWYVMQGNSMVYQNYLRIYKYPGNVLRMDHTPALMVSGTAIPDQSGGPNAGTIVWGANPSGIEITVGGITSSESTTSAPVGGETVPEVFHVPATIPTSVNETAVVSNLPQYVLVHAAGQSLGWTDFTMYAVLMLFGSLAMLFAGLVATGSIWVGVGLGGAFLGMAASTGIVMALGISAAVVLLILLGYFLLRHN